MRRERCERPLREPLCELSPRPRHHRLVVDRCAQRRRQRDDRLLGTTRRRSDSTTTRPSSCTIRRTGAPRTTGAPRGAAELLGHPQRDLLSAPVIHALTGRQDARVRGDGPVFESPADSVARPPGPLRTYPSARSIAPRSCRSARYQRRRRRSAPATAVWNEPIKLVDPVSGCHPRAL